MSVIILLFVFMGILCATTCFGKMSAWSRKYQLLGCIQTNGTEVKLNSKYFIFLLWGWYFCKFQAVMDQFFLCVNTGTVIPCSPAGRLKACGSSMCCKGWNEYSWRCVNVCAGTCKQTLYRPRSEVAMQPKLSALLLLSIKEQSEVSPCLPVFCLSLNQQFSAKICGLVSFFSGFCWCIVLFSRWETSISDRFYC